MELSEFMTCTIVSCTPDKVVMEKHDFKLSEFMTCKYNPEIGKDYAKIIITV